MLRKLYYKLSPELRFTARKLYYFPTDLYETLTGKRGKYEPKKGDIYTGPGNFRLIGNQQVNLLKIHAGLKPENRVLDIGCGIGRTASILTEFLSKEGSYEGFDAVEKGILWCQNTIGKDFRNFKFKYVPLENDLYNKNSQKAVDFKFPYEDDSFDTVFLFSVFTHMQPDEVQHYLKEIRRVLKKDGKCLATFFILSGKYPQREKEVFPFQKGNYRLMDENVVNANIAFEEEFLNQMIEASGLQKSKFISGFWKDFNLKSDENEFQDVILLTK